MSLSCSCYLEAPAWPCVTKVLGLPPSLVILSLIMRTSQYWSESCYLELPCPSFTTWLLIFSQILWMSLNWNLEELCTSSVTRPPFLLILSLISRMNLSWSRRRGLLPCLHYSASFCLDLEPDPEINLRWPRRLSPTSITWPPCILISSKILRILRLEAHATPALICVAFPTLLWRFPCDLKPVPEHEPQLVKRLLPGSTLHLIHF
jgi:hypothetical protein